MTAPLGPIFSIKLNKKIKSAMIYPLTLIFTLILECGLIIDLIFSNRWKVVPGRTIHNSGATYIANKYRSVVLLQSYLNGSSKLLTNGLQTFSLNNTISNRQFGFSQTTLKPNSHWKSLVGSFNRLQNTLCVFSQTQLKLSTLFQYTLFGNCGR